jgi:hypothetical protein
MLFLKLDIYNSHNVSYLFMRKHITHAINNNAKKVQKRVTQSMQSRADICIVSAEASA